MASSPPPPPPSSPTGSRVRPTFVRSANTSSDIDNLYRYVDTKVDAVRSEVTAIRTEMKADIATVMAEFRTAEGKRHTDYMALTMSLDGVKSELPTKSDIQKSTRNWAIGLGGFVIALAALLWAFFDTGVGISGAVADQVLDTERRQNEILERLTNPAEKAVEPEASPTTGKAG